MLTQETLREFGLNDTEIAIYLALLSVGSASSSVLGRRIEVGRTLARHACHQLEKAGLVTVRQQKNTLIFTPEPLEKLHYLLGQERRKLDKREDKLKIVIGDLKAIMNPDIVGERWIKIYEGIEGVKRVYEDTLVEQQMIYAFEDESVFSPGIEDYISLDYRPRRIKKGIFAQVISPLGPLNEQLRRDDHKNLRSTKFFHPDIFPVEADINIYGNKIAFFSYKQEQMFGAIIESAAIASTMKAFFNLCWSVIDDDLPTPSTAKS